MTGDIRTRVPSRRERGWPELRYEDLAPDVDHLRRLVQVAGKYTLDEAFEPGWGNVVFDVSPRGLRTPTLRRDGVTFTVHYRLLDSDVVIETDTGVRVLPLRDQSVAEFYAVFVAAAAQLGLPGPGSTVTAEIAGAPALDADRARRRWDPGAARLIWEGLDAADGALKRWQAPYRGHRPRVGVMWGGFDLSATRYRGVKTTPPPCRQQAGPLSLWAYATTAGTLAARRRAASGNARDREVPLRAARQRKSPDGSRLADKHPEGRACSMGLCPRSVQAASLVDGAGLAGTCWPARRPGGPAAGRAGCRHRF